MGNIINDNVESIINKIEKLLVELGFEEVFFERSWQSRLERNFTKGNIYCRPDYFDSCFVMEYVRSFEDAKNNLHEDGVSFSLKMGGTAILEGIRRELLQEIIPADVPVMAKAI